MCISCPGNKVVSSFILPTPSPNNITFIKHLLANENATNQVIQFDLICHEILKTQRQDIDGNNTTENLYLEFKSSYLQLFIMPNIEPWMGIIFPIPAVKNINKR